MQSLTDLKLDGDEMKKIFAANWKLQKTPAESAEFAKDFLANTSVDFFKDKDVFIFPQNFSLDAVQTAFKNTNVKCGPQNIHTEKSGAFTGENSAEISKKMGCELVLLGHSERRQFFNETNTELEKKVKICQDLDLQIVFCIGETLPERESNQTEAVCFNQLEEGLFLANKNKKIVVAYEPVWAIGTGKVASPEQVEDIHLKLHKKMRALGFIDFHILYGGSVKPDNAAVLIKIPHVDGFLIGGASLDVKSFLQICLAN